MSWFQSTNLASFAKTALKEAQKTIDKALDIKEEEDGGANGTNARQSAAAAANSVSEMASDFFAAWGVGQNPSPAKSAGSTTPRTEINGSDDNRLPGTISTPPKRCSTMDDLLLANNIEQSDTNSSSIISDVPVTLIASCENLEDNGRTLEQLPSDNEYKPKVEGFSGKHTRSLSDTIFHASNDSNNLGDIVQVLDDSIDVDTTENSVLSVSSQFLEFPLQVIDNNSVSDSISNEEDLRPEVNENALILQSNDAVKDNRCEEKSNLELLQEIDLNGSAPGVEGDTLEEESNIVITSTDLNPVESSGLSDGWDWTSTIDSSSIEEVNPVKEVTFEGTASELPAKQENHGTEQILTVCEDAIVSSSEEKEEVVTCTETINVPVSVTAPEEDTTINEPKLVPSLSSRTTSPLGQDLAGGESTPPSSARVSPNFEMVTSCAPNSHLPESSRSSSIVVVSGRESTLNSRGTSGAGSSGSSEGGHDIVDAEVVAPPSPAVVPSTEEFPRSKHRKEASTSSSSDIEVIPSDYSSSSSAPQVPPTHTSKVSNSDIACQTDVSVSIDGEAQTEEAEDSSTKAEDLSKFVTAEVADILAEKDAEVQQLREEGEKLSKKQFELTQVIKKLRAKEKETEGVVKGLRTDIATKNLELEKLMKTFISKEGIEQTQNDTISKLNQERRRLELKVEQLHSELEDARDNVESMKATVENASIEILELKNVISSVQRDSAEVDRLTRDKGELISRSESLQKEVDHLRSTLNSSQSSHHSREAELKAQISILTQKCHQLEYQLADISTEVADATMPLSLEIEKLQSELKQQVSQADRREQALQSNISDLELKLKTASERERSAKELQIQYQSQYSSLELRINELEDQNKSLQEQVQQKEEIFQKKLDDKTARCQKLEKTVERLTGEVERLSSENDLLSNELKTERSSLEIERRRVSQNLVSESRENNNMRQSQHQRSSSMSTTSSSTIGGNHPNHVSSRNPARNDNSREHSPSEHSMMSEDASYLDEVFDPNSGMLVGGNGNRSMTPKSFFDSFSSAGLIENLQGQLRMRELEAIAFQEELSKNEKIRKQLNEEIANLTMQNQQLSLDMEKLTEMEQRLEEVDKNYNAVLQMYGEKVEEADELRMDLEDVKEMYKAQIEQLLKKS